MARDEPSDDGTLLNDKQLALRAYVLGVICADRRTRKDAEWERADRQLRALVPEINRRGGAQ